MPRKSPPKYTGVPADRPAHNPRPPRRDGDPRLVKPLDLDVKPGEPKTVPHDPHAQREAAKYARPIPSREVILALLGSSELLLTIELIAERLQLTSSEDREALDKRLNAMLRDGQLLMNRRGGFGLAQKLDLITGTVLANADGFGFLRPDDSGTGEDIFLAPVQMKQVLHGDRVLVSVTGTDRRGRPEGMIASILSRRSPRVVGRYLDEALFGVVAPDDRRIHQDIQIPRGSSGDAKPGDVVVAEISEPPTAHRPPIGRVLRVIGSELGPQHAVELAIESFDLPHVWPEGPEREAAAFGTSVSAQQTEGRVDLRKLPLVTIDGEDARDFDDAVWCEPTKSGSYKLIVAIADVASYVQPGTELDKEALNRSTSVYFPQRVIPMLPEALSNGLCSLKPEVDRLCLACEMLIDGTGKIKRSKFYPAVMRSAQRLTYSVVWQALGEREPGALERVAKVLPQLENLYALYHVLQAERQQRGAIEFSGTEVRFGFNEQGGVQMVARYERNDAHRLIEECMIAANVAAAKFLDKSKVPSLYRVHLPPPESKYEDARAFLAELGVSVPTHDELTPLSISEALQKSHGRPDASLIEAVLLRTQSLAIYDAVNAGHFGLALPAYGHFTSPIRRYPDLLVHRAIYHALAGGKAANYGFSQERMAELGKHCSANERRADEASRDVNERLKCAFLENHIGDEFEGLVTGVTSFGCFVEIDDTRISGMVHVTQLPNDYYHFDQSRRRLWGERTRMGIQLSDRVRIKVLRVDSVERKIDFKLVSGLREVPAGELSSSPSPNKGGPQKSHGKADNKGNKFRSGGRR